MISQPFILSLLQWQHIYTNLYFCSIVLMCFCFYIYRYKLVKSIKVLYKRNDLALQYMSYISVNLHYELSVIYQMYKNGNVYACVSCDIEHVLNVRIK
jgi:hypothetical protein